MKALEEQFICVEPQLKATCDGVDATEGAISITNKKFNQIVPGAVTVLNRKKTSKKY